MVDVNRAEHKLYWASAKGYDDEVLRLLQNGTPPDSDYYNDINYGWSPLQQACANNHPGTAQLLIKWGARVDGVLFNEKGTHITADNTALHWACFYGSMNTVTLLLEQNCRTDILNSDGETAIELATRRGRQDIAQYITNHKPRPIDPLALYPSVEQMRQLQINEWHKLALYFKLSASKVVTISKSENPTAATLVAAKVKNAEINWENIVQGILTVSKEGSKVLNLLQSIAAQSEALEVVWDTAFSLACASKDLSSVKYLINSYSCDPAKPLNEAGDTALSIACASGHLNVVKYIVEVHHCEPKRNKAGLTPFSLACANGHLNTAKYLIDAFSCEASEPLNEAGDTPLSLACANGHLETVKHLVNVLGNQCNTNSCLLVAAKRNQKHVVEFFLDECNSDPNVEDSEGRTPLALTKDTEIIKLLLKHGADSKDVYTVHTDLIGKLSSERPPDIPLSVFITGDGGVGKSTLLKAMLSSQKSGPVTNVDARTVGIIPHDIDTEEFGRVTMHDFAGQPEFYASHCAVLQNAIRISPPIILYCANLKDSEENLADSTAWWMTLVQNQCKDMIGEAHIIVVGSHADILKEGNEDPREKEFIFAPIIKKFPKFKFVAFNPMDCRFPNSPEMKVVKKHVQSSSAMLRSSEAVNFNAHTFNIYLRDTFKEELGVSVKVVMTNIHYKLQQAKSAEEKELLSFIPSTLSRLIEVCDQLSKGGLILFLHNKDIPENSFIVCDQPTLLSKVTGTVFAPEEFRQHCKLASSTGVVPLSKFAEEFKSYDTEMLIAFMTRLELCFEIADKVVLATLDPDFEGETSKRYLFFPGLIRIEVPKRLWEKSAMTYHFGWVLQTFRDIEFFDSRCFQVLVLRLVFTFHLAPARVQHDVPSLQRFCSVWKSGICWCDEDGITSHLELSDNRKSLVLKIRSRKFKLENLIQRSKVIKKILDTVKDYCPSLSTTESLIDPFEVIEHPLISTSSLTLCTLSDTVVAIIKKKEEVRSERAPVELQDLLQFDPYMGLDRDTMQCTHSEKFIMMEEKISDGFLSHLAHQLADSKHAEIYHKILTGEKADDPKDEMVRGLETWRKSTQGTYKCLRETLNKYSVCAGRNPLDLADIPHSEFDPSLFPEPGSDALPLATVIKRIWDLRSEWYSLAIQLQISYGLRKSIQRTRRDEADACFRDVVKQWVRRTSPPPTWASLLEALRSPIIGRNDIAEHIVESRNIPIEPNSDETATNCKGPSGSQDVLGVDSHLKLVREITWNLRAHWYKLGVQLGIDTGSLQVIQHNYRHDAATCFTALFEMWLTGSSPVPTWAALTEALRSNVMDRNDTADMIEALFCK